MRSRPLAGINPKGIIMEKIEYRVRPVTRFIVTRYEQVYPTMEDKSPGSSRQIGNEYANAETAYEVGYALCRAEHERLGYPPGDERICYPLHPDEVALAEKKIGQIERHELASGPGIFGAVITDGPNKGVTLGEAMACDQLRKVVGEGASASRDAVPVFSGRPPYHGG